MAYYGLVEFENQSKKGYDNATYVRITNAGAYYLNELIYKFAYLDLVWMDTPILDWSVVDDLLKPVVELKGYKDPRDLDDRFYRTKIFLDYIKEMEEMDFENNPELRESDLMRKEFVPKIIESFQEEKQYIQSKRDVGFADGSPP